MANEYNYDYERGRYGRSDYDEPYYRRQGRGDRPYYRGSSSFDEPSHSGYGYGSYYNEPYRSQYDSAYSEPSGSYDYGRYEYGDRSNESYYRRGNQSRSRESYDRGRDDRGLMERAGDEVRSWFGDEEAERRRQMDRQRSESHAGRGPRNYRRSDERIREDVNDRLTDDWWIDASDIEVSVSNGVVTLSGRVDSRDDKRRAEDIAEDVKGVTDVTNQLRVGQSSSTTTTATETSSTTRSKAARI
jgi:osmotically-inducible protein OsmY